MAWRMLDLFSGIGGFSLAAQWCWGDELEIVAFCEIDKFCQKVLRKHWPNVPIIEDVRDVTKETIENSLRSRCLVRELEEQINIGNKWNISTGDSKWIHLLTGGFPCQPFSVAGKRKGKEDNRFLWPEMFAVIKEIRPRWVVAENVAGIVRMALDDCLSDLEGEGYSTGTVIIPACAVNAPHRRDRVWIVAHAEQFSGRRGFSERLPDNRWLTASEKSEGLQSKNGEAYRGYIEQGSQDVAYDEGDRWDSQAQQEMDAEKDRREKGCGFDNSSQDVADTTGRRLIQCPSEGESQRNNSQGDRWWSTESRLGGMVDGISDWSYEPKSVPRVAKGIPERVNRLKSLGNAIVPQVAFILFKAIKEIEDRS